MRRLVLTPEEKRVLIFVAVAFLLGLGVKHYRETRREPAAHRGKKGDSAEIDRTFPKGFFSVGRKLEFSPVGMESSAINTMRVLIADDQKGVGATLASLVSHCNHEVVEVVESGLEAIQAYSRHRPDVVLMDYWMSKLNGATACRNILAKDPNARVILVSAWSPLQELENTGAISVLSKPVDLERLREALDAALAAGQPALHVVEDWAVA